MINKHCNLLDKTEIIVSLEIIDPLSFVQPIWLWYSYQLTKTVS